MKLKWFFLVIGVSMLWGKSVTDFSGRKVEIPDAPKRIASLHVMSVSAILVDLYAPMVGSSTYIKQPQGKPYLRGVEEALGVQFEHLNIANYGKKGEDIERIKRSKPDLIIGTVKYQKRNAKQLSKIAPTVLIKRYTPNTFDLYKQIAHWVNKTPIFERRYRAYQRKIDAFKARHAKALKGKTFIYFSPYPKDGTVNIRQNSGVLTQVLYDLGLERTDFVKRHFKPDEKGDEVSAEVIGELDADFVFVSYTEESNQDQAWVHESMDTLAKGWQKSLKAYQKGHFIPISRERSFVPVFDTVDYVLQTFERHLEP